MDGIDLRLGPFRSFQPQPAQPFHQRLGQRGKIEPQLVALHFVGRKPVGEQDHLLLDAVLHLAEGADRGPYGQVFVRGVGVELLV